MITADKLKLLTSLTATSLSQVIQRSGYKAKSFDPAQVKGSRFLGMSNGGEFVYELTSLTERKDLEVKKVFVRYDSSHEAITAGF
jgi:surfactin synthase thioesterase subunit